jgi:hypothetical protein
MEETSFHDGDGKIVHESLSIVKGQTEKEHWGTVWKKLEKWKV